MPLETSSNRDDHQSTGEGDKHRHLDKDIRDMVSAITRRISGIHKPGSSHREVVDDDDEQGVRIITLAGNNAGATMRSEMDEKSSSPHGISLDEPDALSTYVNSNFQAVNNSIMLGSSYNANDPGVHLDVSDVFEREGRKPENKPRRRGKKKEEGSDKSEQSD